MAVSDATVVVVDTGSSTTKAGFAGESFPRAEFPSVVGRLRRPGLVDGFPLIYCGREAIEKRGLSCLKWPISAGLVQDWEELEKLWHHTFYKELHVPPEETRIMHALHPLVPGRDKERMSEILFETFAINGIYLAKSPILVLYASGRTSGLVWECGHSCSYAAPVFEGFPLKNATVCSSLTGEVLSNRFQKLLAETGYSFTTPVERDLMDQIKAEKCYIVPDYEAKISEAVSAGENKTRYDLPDGQHVLLDEELYQCPELLFQPSLGGLDCPNIVDVICSSVNKCDMDYRAMFYENVVLGGGSSMFQGLSERLHAELASRLKGIPGMKAGVDAMTSRRFAAWAGGSIMASMSSLKGFWMTKAEYEDVGPERVHYKFF
ncbi:actin-85C-like [Manduca sexta]|uniref:Uncharacterized protein n=1 Tax=Manduca sexta TaxID=7130 RepID=A0A921YWK4_MANSE|nr:actin-85C-like [Manduca sexta]KAG6446952.1 hypothetical protein O3G_MSEX004685 [Manduca sexta]